MTAPLLLALSATLALPQTPPSDTSSPRAAFEELAGGFLDFHRYFNPVDASLVGDRDYDARLPDMSRSAIQARADAYQAWIDRLRGIDESALVGDAVQDRIVVEYAIRTQLLDLVEVRSWERDPAHYLDILARGIAILTEDTGVPARDRMRALTSRFRQAPTLLAEGRSNLQNPPLVFTQRAALGARRLAHYVRTVVPPAFASVEPGPARSEFERALTQAAEEIEAFGTFLENELAPRSNGSHVLGAERLGWTLRYRDYVEVDPGQVIDVLEREIAAAREGVTAARAERSTEGPGIAWSEAAEIASRTTDGARNRIFRDLFATVPSDARPVVATRPPLLAWDRWSVWGPGPFQPFDGPATLYLVEEPGTAPTAAEIAAVTLEVAFPGEFLQALYARRAPTRVRKTFRSPSLQRGWGLYAAEAMAADGFDQDAAGLEQAHRRRRLLGLVQARTALLVHLGQLNLEEAAERISEEAGIAPERASSLAAQAAHRPLEEGVLGALQIRTLRDDFLSQDQDRTVRRFHDALLGSGLPPALARSVLLPGDARPALR
jgi:hypothetical protein